MISASGFIVEVRAFLIQLISFLLNHKERGYTPTYPQLNPVNVYQNQEIKSDFINNISSSVTGLFEIFLICSINVNKRFYLVLYLTYKFDLISK